MSWLDPFGIVNMADSFLHPEKGYKRGQEQLNQYYQQGQGYLTPYNQYGQSAYGNYSDAMQKLLDPTALQATWEQGYKESPSAKYAEQLAQEHGLDAASSMGLMGSNTALNAIQGGTTQIGLDDRQRYMDNLMQKYLAGAGIAGNIFGTGANVANTMATNAMNMGQNSAQMAFGQQNAPGNLFGNLLGAGVGFMAGGPAGAAMGAGAMGGGAGSGWSFGGR